MGYICEHMDPKNKLAPLFEAQLELLEPDMVFAPSLDPNNEKGFMALIQSLINDIVKMSSLVDRISPRKEDSYEAQIVKSDDVTEMKEDILNNIDRVSNISSSKFLWKLNGTKVTLQ